MSTAFGFQALNRASRAMAQLYGYPVAGKSGAITLDATDKTVTLEGGKLYILTIASGDAFIAVDALATTVANRFLLLSGSSAAFMFNAPNTSPVLHVTAGPTAGGTLYYAQLDDRG